MTSPELGRPCGSALPARSVSLRTIFLVSLLVFCVVPAAVVGWVLYRSNEQTSNQLAAAIVRDVAQRIQTDTEDHLLQAQVIFNGLIPTRGSPSELARARELVTSPELFEKTAFALTRMGPAGSYLYFGSANGEFVGVEPIGLETEGATRVGIQKVGETARRFYDAQFAGDRSGSVTPETKKYDPTARPWYLDAVAAGKRVFTPIYAAASKKQLVITLSQPIFDEAGKVLGVFASEVYLKRLSELMQSLTISPRGVAFLVDDQAFLVASSAGDALYSEGAGKIERLRPNVSANPVVRASYADLIAQASLSAAPANPGSSAAAASPAAASKANVLMRRIPFGDDALLVTSRPFGESDGLRWRLVVAVPESDFTASTQAAIEKTLAVIGLAMALAAVLAISLAYGFTRRFRHLAVATAQLGRGEVPPLQSHARVTEVQMLAGALHGSGLALKQSRAALQSKTEALQDANEHLEDRVAQRTNELVTSREAALDAARAKASFLATMSHEIRTPLNGVVGMTTLLADTRLNHEQRDYLHTMRVSSDQLLGVINDILDFSKIESGKLDLESEPLNLQSTIEEACDMAAQRAREKGLELLADIDADVPQWVLGDVTRLRQVLLNFINNAVKFTANGQIVVSAHLSAHLSEHTFADQVSSEPSSPLLLEFRVQDSGIGIPLDRQPALFQSFSQVDASTTRKYGGTGLGLAICKRLATLMGGSVGVQSTPGEGSTFWFTALLAATGAPSHEPGEDEFASLAGKTALLVDDTELNLRILGKQLTRWGMRTVAFERAQLALDWLAAHACDVIITDMHMPDMDGQEFTQKVRRQTPDAHVVLLTSGIMPTGPAAKLFDARLLKPYRQSQLFNALSRVATLPNNSSFGASDHGLSAQSSVANAPQKHMHQRVLVADDNAINLKVALAMLTKLGYDAATASNGREAADAVSQSLSSRPGAVPFAAVLMDVNMPVMDGFEATQLILATHGRAAPALIALTASVLEEDRQRCMDAGMVGFLAKPLRIDELGEALARHAPVASNTPDLIAARARIDWTAGQNDLNNEAKTGQFADDFIDQLSDQFVDSDEAAMQVITHDSAVLDTSRLDRFKAFDDEQLSMTREIVTLFINDQPQRIQDIRHSLEAADCNQLSRAVHALKGSASNVGANALADACGHLEHACLQGEWPDHAVASVTQITGLATQTSAALKQWLQAHQSPADQPQPAR